MGRIFEYVRVNGGRHVALFDSGARQSYVTEPLARQLGTLRLDPPMKVGLGGKVRRLDRLCLLQGKLQGHRLTMPAYVVPELGSDRDGNPIEILIGAETMEIYQIRLIPSQRRLDLTHYQEYLEEL